MERRTGVESVIRFYTPAPTLVEIFERLTKLTFSGNGALAVQSLGRLLRCHVYEDIAADADSIPVPEGAVAWQLVAGAYQGDIRIIADEVISMATLRTCNRQIFDSLTQDSYVGLARNGNDVFIPLRKGDVVTDRTLHVISSPSIEQEPNAALHVR